MTSSRCLSADSLARYVSRPLAAAEERAAADAHVASCGTCRERVAMLRRVVAADAEEVAAAVEEVAALVSRLLDEPEHRWPLLARETMYQSPELARRLIALAVNERACNVRRAAQLAHTAGLITDSLAGAARGVFDLRFDAWKLESALLREAGYYEDCRAALVRAEDAAEQVPDVELARAAVSLSRALVCAEPDIWSTDEALALLDRAEEVYARRDAERLRATLTVRGMLLLRMGRPEQARQPLEKVLAETSPGDEAAYADAQVNLGQAMLSLGNLAEARRLVDNSLAINMGCGRVAIVARNTFVRALVHQAGGEHEWAVEKATRAMLDLQTWKRPDDAIRAGLIAVQSLIALASFDVATALCRRLTTESIALDRREPSRRRALTAEAVTYLRELADRFSLTVDVAATVRTYVEDLAVRPAVAFVPPMPLTAM